MSELGLDFNLLAMLAIGASFAGFVDAVVGGGGLVQIPLLFNLLPDSPHPSLLGTNKLASVIGTSSAAIQYGRRIPIDWHVVLPAVSTAFACSWLGARSVAFFPPDLVRPVVLLLLAAVAVYTFRKKDFGLAHRPPRPGVHANARLAATITAALGFYDGFFGPGTGSFLILPSSTF